MMEETLFVFVSETFRNCLIIIKVENMKNRAGQHGINETCGRHSTVQKSMGERREAVGRKDDALQKVLMQPRENRTGNIDNMALSIFSRSNLAKILYCC